MLYLCSFRPLVATQHGRIATEHFGLSPFVDGSCRREPDLEAAFPAISALCRFRKFAPRLQVGDSVIYITTKGHYGKGMGAHWRLIAILEVIRRFETHVDAAKWHRGRGISLPRNCMVSGNKPLSFEMTNGVLSKRLREQRNSLSSEELVRRWDVGYRYRAKQCGVFLVSDVRFMELQNPPIITNEMMRVIFGRIPGTQNPPRLSAEEFRALWDIALGGVTVPIA